MKRRFPGALAPAALMLGAILSAAAPSRAQYVASVPFPTPRLQLDKTVHDAPHAGRYVARDREKQYIVVVRAEMRLWRTLACYDCGTPKVINVVRPDFANAAVLWPLSPSGATHRTDIAGVLASAMNLAAAPPPGRALVPFAPEITDAMADELVSVKRSTPIRAVDRNRRPLLPPAADPGEGRRWRVLPHEAGEVPLLALDFTPNPPNPCLLCCDCPCGSAVSLCVWPLLELRVPVTVWRTRFDEARAARVPWPREWPAELLRVNRAGFAISEGPDHRGVVLPFDRAPLREYAFRALAEAGIERPEGSTQVRVVRAIAAAVSRDVRHHDPLSAEPEQLHYWFPKQSQAIRGFRPAAPAQVLTAARATPMERALLLTALLREVGLPARPVFGLHAAEGVFDREDNEARYWVEFALYDEEFKTTDWVLLDGEQMLRTGGRDGLGQSRELEFVVPFANALAPPGTVRMSAPARYSHGPDWTPEVDVPPELITPAAFFGYFAAITENVPTVERQAVRMWVTRPSIRNERPGPPRDPGPATPPPRGNSSRP